MAPIITDKKLAAKILGKFFRTRNQYFINDYRATPEGIITRATVYLCQTTKPITSLPIQFYQTDSFVMRHSLPARRNPTPGSLTTLDGSPMIVKNEFNVSGNNLSDLIGGPATTGSYDAHDNPLTSLNGLPKSCEMMRLDYTHIPMLRLLGVEYTLVRMQPVDLMTRSPNGDEANKVAGIFDTYIEQIIAGTSLKQAIWECQKELIDNGFEDIAKW
jgi:hypothetical protein